MNLHLIAPMAAMVFGTLTFGVFMLWVRVTAVRTGVVDPRYFKTFDYGKPTELVVKTQRHFTNLFEIPVLFYAGCLTATLVNVQGPWIMRFAWLFVASRLLHACVHVGANKIYPRIFVFLLATVAVFAMWVEIVLSLDLV